MGLNLYLMKQYFMRSIGLKPYAIIPDHPFLNFGIPFESISVITKKLKAMKTLFVLATALILSTGLFARPYGYYGPREFHRGGCVVHAGFGIGCGFGPCVVVGRPYYGGGYGYYRGGRCDRGYYYHGRCGRRW